MNDDALAQIRAINERAAFNRWLGLEIVEAGDGVATIRMKAHPEATQYVGFLHAGVIGALLDTACGYAAATQVGSVLASHYSVNCLAPALGHAFEARGEVVRAGKRQIFTRAELYAEKDGARTLVAMGETLLLRANF